MRPPRRLLLKRPQRFGTACGWEFVVMKMGKDPIKVGVLFSKTGVTSTIEVSQLQGTLLAFEEINEAGGIDGRELLPVYYDPASSPGMYKTLAEKLIVDDGVRTILGCYMSSTRKAVLPVVQRWNAMLMYPTLYEGFEYSDNVVYTGAAPNQNSIQLADFMLREFGSRVYMVGSDYVYPYESNRIMSDILLERGGKRIAERYVKLDAGAGDFTEVVDDIKRQQPDFIFSTVVGQATAHFYRAYADAGLDSARMPIASLTTSEAEVAEMGADVAAGHITAAAYFQSVDTELNRRCVAKVKARHGGDAVTNMCWEAAYFQTYLLAGALNAVGTDNIQQLLPAIFGMEFSAPQGPVRIDAANHHTYLTPRIGRVARDGQFEILHAAARPVKPDPYLVDHSAQDWSSQVPVARAV
jgi:branched-chain amino acid transport system substrate-binding protein